MFLLNISLRMADKIESDYPCYIQYSIWHTFGSNIPDLLKNSESKSDLKENYMCHSTHLGTETRPVGHCLWLSFHLKLMISCKRICWDRANLIFFPSHVLWEHMEKLCIWHDKTNTSMITLKWQLTHSSLAALLDVSFK